MNGVGKSFPYQAFYLPAESANNATAVSIDLQKRLMPESNDNYILKARKVDNATVYDVYGKNIRVFSSRCAPSQAKRIAITEDIQFDINNLIYSEPILDRDITHLDLAYYSRFYPNFIVNQGELRKFLEKFPNLTSIAMVESHIDTVLEICSNLTSIKLYRCSSTRLKLIIEKFPNLTSLDLSDCKSVKIKTFVTSLPELRSINLSGCSINSEDIQILAKSHPNLISVNLSSNEEIDDKAIIALAENSHELESLALSRGLSFSDKALCSLIEKCTKLAWLDLSSCKFSDKLLLNLHAPNLYYISLINNDRITDEGIEAFITKHPKLTSVFLGSCPKITDAGVEKIAESLHENLIAIDISSCNLKEKGCLSLAHYCPNLGSIKLSANNCPNIVSLILKLGIGCPNLSEIKLISASFTNEEIKAITLKLPNLASIVLKSCRVTRSFLDILVQNCPRLASITLDDCRYTRNSYLAFKEAYPQISISWFSEFND